MGAWVVSPSRWEANEPKLYLMIAARFTFTVP